MKVQQVRPLQRIIHVELFLYALLTRNGTLAALRMERALLHPL